MKKSLFLSMFAIATFSLVITSCKKDETEVENPPTATMSATIDGVAWTADQSGCTVINGVTGVAGTQAQGQTITITVSKFKEGGYSLYYESQVNVGIVTDGNVSYTTNSDQACNGQMYISEINTNDSTISGNFYFKAYSPFGKGFIEVTDGVFSNIPFTNELPPTPENSFEVDIDGTTFTPSSINATSAMGKIMITASDSQVSQTVGITVEKDIAVGTHEISFFGDVIGQYNIGTTILMSASSGTLVLTKHDQVQKVLEGTFDFEAEEFMGTNSASLTNGSFSISY